MLHVRLLGELQADVDGVAVEPPASRRAWSLLAWLALHPGDHSRGALAARFWPDVLDASARASLRSAIWALRRALGPAGDEAVLTARGRVGLACETDVQAFDIRVAADELEAAVELCCGPLLADLDDDWVLEARDEHAERVGAALGRLAATAAAPGAAVVWARRRAALDPLDEDAARDLMRRLVAAGDRAGALAAYDRLSERLRTTLGLAPSAATRALAAGVRTPEPDPQPAGAATPPEPPGDRAAARGLDGPPLVGRDAELAQLEALWARARDGGGALAIIGGEGGIGKTRLAGELVARARAQGARAGSCAALDLGGAPPFGLWSELLAALARQLDPPAADATWPQELARLAPALPRRLGRPATAPGDVAPDLARARLFEAAVEMAEHATTDRPLVLVFDDVHLADAPSLELAAYLARRIASLPVLVLLTRRTTPRRDEVDALIHAARARGVVVGDIDLEPLPPEDVGRLVGTIAAALGADERERVVAAADGNPLLAVESARAAGRGDERPPSTLRAAVRAAVAGLSGPARRTAELAAVAGRDLDRSELVALAAPQSVLDAMDCGLFRSADGRFGFRHALLRDAVYADLEDARRRSLHEALGAAPGVRASEAARHLRLAGRDDLAAGRLLQAAADAARATAFQEAVGFLRAAIALRPAEPGARLELAEAAAVLGDRETSLAELDAAVRLLDPADARGRASAHVRAARWFRGSLCDPAAAGAAAQRGLDVLDDADLEELDVRAELLAVRAWSEVTVTGAGAASDSLRVLEALDLQRTPMRRHDIDTVQAYIEIANGRLREAEDLLVQTAETGERAGRPDMAYGGWANAACVAAAAGDLGAALEHAERGVRVVSGLPVVAFQMYGIRAYVRARLGRHAEARADCDRQAELAQRLGSPQLAALADHDAGLLALLADDHERAQALLGRALEGEPAVQRAEARLRRAEALARLGRADEADAEIRAATMEPVRPSHRPAVLVARMAFAQGLSARARGDRALAARRLEEAAGHWRRMAGETGWARDHLASLVDLGRPPVAGVVSPERELDRAASALSELEAVPT
jgi:DNA-binding SARP family transcriptional activator/tetratricopeptide (TPR) repeat protein